MYSSAQVITLVIIAANIIVSWQGFRDPSFFMKYHFNPERVLGGREYIRLVSSGFLHANSGHLMFNMLALYSFSVGVSTVFGAGRYLIIYLGSLIAGNLLALYIRRNDRNYRAVGASGAVSGIVYASILMYPHGGVGILFLPFTIPSWLFGILFILVSIFGIRSSFGNIGHEAHLGGAIAGLFLTMMMDPGLAAEHPLLTAALLVPTAAFLFILARNPGLFSGGTRPRAARRPDISIMRDEEGGGARSGGRSGAENDDDNGGIDPVRRAMMRELDILLDKVARSGIDSLSKKEKARLYTLSGKLGMGKQD
jgi:membrane associated rhomboid family serine protease